MKVQKLRNWNNEVHSPAKLSATCIFPVTLSQFLCQHLRPSDRWVFPLWFPDTVLRPLHFHICHTVQILWRWWCHGDILIVHTRDHSLPFDMFGGFRREVLQRKKQKFVCLCYWFVGPKRDVMLLWDVCGEKLIYFFTLLQHKFEYKYENWIFKRERESSGNMGEFPRLYANWAEENFNGRKKPSSFMLPFVRLSCFVQCAEFFFVPLKCFFAPFFRTLFNNNRSRAKERRFFRFNAVITSDRWCQNSNGKYEGKSKCIFSSDPQSYSNFSGHNERHGTNLSCWKLHIKMLGKTKRKSALCPLCLFSIPKAYII